MPFGDLQIEYALISRGIENGILATCRELGIGITAYGVLSRGLISGHWRKDATQAGDFRAHSPRFQARERRQEPGSCRNVAAYRGAAKGLTRRSARNRVGAGSR